MNVSLPQPMEKFVRRKVAIGDYETASEVVREGLRLLQQRDEVWKSQIREGIEEAYASLPKERLLSEEEVKAEMRAFRARRRKKAK